ncbi:hypothetical protein A0H81_10540 [Grifola frondosa]|nr:hypothetical protein A0H81_10540 [Grifola frondosa]
MEPPQPTLHLHIANSVHGVTIAIPCASAPSAVASSATVTASQGFALRIEPERVPDASPDASQGLAMRVEHERHMDGSLSVQYYVELVHYPQNFLARNGCFPCPLREETWAIRLSGAKSWLASTARMCFAQIFLFFCEERVTHDYAFEEISKMVRMASTADPQDLDMNLLKIVRYAREHLPWSKFMRSYTHLPSYYNAEE